MTKQGDMIYVFGQESVIPETEEVESDDIRDQTA